jgi:RimJ/RimL family protein N-acetyltransferase
VTTAPIPLPDPPLGDGVVRLRPWRPGDVDALVAAWADPEIACWTGVPPRRDRAYADRWIAGEAHRRAEGLALDLVVELEGVLAGEVGLAGFDRRSHTAEIGWWVAADHRGRGIATRAVSLLASWTLDELCTEVLVARCAAGNPASAGVARAAGFKPSTPQITNPSAKPVTNDGFRLPVDAGSVESWTFGGTAGGGTVPS